MISCPVCTQACDDDAQWCSRCKTELLRAPPPEAQPREAGSPSDRRTLLIVLSLGGLLVVGGVVGMLAVAVPPASPLPPRVAERLDATCRTERWLKCDCAHAELARVATPADLEAIANREDETTFRLHELLVSVFARCADTGAFMKSLVDQCVKDGAQRGYCTCVADRSLAAFSVQELVDATEAMDNGRPAPPAMLAIFAECRDVAAPQ